MASLSERSEQHWVDQWERQVIPWHRDKPDSQLQAHINLLTKGTCHSVVFVPFCGKSVDILWLSVQGYTVVGVELSPLAVKQFFEENNLAYCVANKGKFTVYQALDRNIKIFIGSLFDLSLEETGLFDAIWDCRALGAVNISQRKEYIKILLTVLKPTGNILVSHLEYDTLEHNGPPFSLSTATLHKLFGREWSVECVEYVDLSGTSVAVEHNLTWANGLLHHIHSSTD